MFKTLIGHVRCTVC